MWQSNCVPPQRWWTLRRQCKSALPATNAQAKCHIPCLTVRRFLATMWSRPGLEEKRCHACCSIPKTWTNFTKSVSVIGGTTGLVASPLFPICYKLHVCPTHPRLQAPPSTCSPGLRVSPAEPTFGQNNCPRIGLHSRWPQVLKPLVARSNTLDLGKKEFSLDSFHGTFPCHPCTQPPPFAARVIQDGACTFSQRAHRQ